MFASLKNKIKEETGSEVVGNAALTPGITPHQRSMIHSNTSNNNNRLKSRVSSSMSITSNNDETQNEQALRQEIANYQTRLQQLQEEKLRVEKTNEILLETVKVAQTQKDIYCEEQEKIQNMQQGEIEKLRNLLSFREQEAVDRLNAMRQHQQQVENLTSELERLKHCEPQLEEIKDELQQLMHSSQQEKNNLTITLAAIEEENRHLKMRLQIVEQTRLEALGTFGTDEKLQALVQERKHLEQRLEEAHLQLSDIKSSWMGQNLALETQVSRLSKQVAEETTEKRKILKQKDDLIERVKHLEFELLKSTEEIKQRDDKIKLLEEEIDELNAALKECREENEQQILFERSKVESLELQNKELQNRLEAADERFGEYAANSANVTQSLRQQIADLQTQINETQMMLEAEKEEKLTALLKNAEISQSEELLKKELRQERDEVNDIHELNKDLESQLKSKEQCIQELQTTLSSNDKKLKEFDEMQRDVIEKNKTIKVLNQRVNDLKKTLQKEFTSAKVVGISDELSSADGRKEAKYTLAENPRCQNCISIDPAAAGGQGGSVIMDEVNFKYLKHVIVKFLTSREVEARHLIRAVATLLKLTKEEEKLLHDTLNWKMSWFGSRPDHGRGQRAFSIPPS
ncbi:golgin subfamily A member 1 [Musca domestica]|uniref:Golgin subfamily A member 1 n=1 Tax=Musca domestica TaxID=7370 RepID=A0ABM3V1J4_MUSDO|nr:golgin subfamily A member 1 [Musca domestica]